MDDPIVTLTDDAGRTLPCQVEATFELEGTEYFLLQPVNPTVQIFAWEESEEDADEAMLEAIDDEELYTILPTARAVLAEHNLELQDTPYVLTVAGDIPLAEEEDIIEIDTDDEEEFGEFQAIAEFYHEEQQYSIYLPLDPMLIFAKRLANGKLEPLSDEEILQIEPMIEVLVEDDGDGDEDEDDE